MSNPNPFHTSLPTGASRSDRAHQIIDSLSAHGYLNVKDDRDYDDIETIVNGVLVATHSSETRAGEQEGSTMTLNDGMKLIKKIEACSEYSEKLVLLADFMRAASVQGEGVAPMPNADDFSEEWRETQRVHDKFSTRCVEDMFSLYWTQIEDLMNSFAKRVVAAQAAEIEELKKNQEREFCGDCDHGVAAGKVCDSCNGTGYKERRSEDLASQLKAAQQERDDLKEHLRTIEVDYVEKRNRLANAVKRAEAAETLVGELRRYVFHRTNCHLSMGLGKCTCRLSALEELLTSTLKVKPKISRVMSPEGHSINRRGPMMKDCYKKKL